MNLRWFLSKTVRHATAMRKHVRNLLNAQRDILSPQAVQTVATALEEYGQTLQLKLKREELVREMEKLDQVATKWLKPYPNHAWRENVEVFLVALAVAMAIRTFFLQPFKIPTGSMQPTLFGVTSEPDFTKVRQQPDMASAKAEFHRQVAARNELKIPGALTRFREWFEGYSYLDVKAKVDGRLEQVNAPVGIRIINFWQTLYIGGVAHTIFFPPDYGSPDLAQRAGLQPGTEYRKGEAVVKLKVQAGDHLFVDRLTYNFRAPKRGEIVVFQTAGIQHERMQQDQFYIKRLVALGGERVQIGDDRHLVINGQRLDATTPHFENVYGFAPSEPAGESKFSGHVNEVVAQKYGLRGNVPLFPNAETIHTNAPDGLMVMGDNTLNSFDSRAWGEFPATNIIGKQFFVYWPITSRFGWGNR